MSPSNGLSVSDQRGVSQGNTTAALGEQRRIEKDRRGAHLTSPTARRRQFHNSHPSGCLSEIFEQIGISQSDAECKDTKKIITPISTAQWMEGESSSTDRTVAQGSTDRALDDARVRERAASDRNRLRELDEQIASSEPVDGPTGKRKTSPRIRSPTRSPSREIEETKSPSTPMNERELNSNQTATREFPTAASPATSIREFPSSPASDYLAQRYATQQQQWLQEQLAQQQRAHMEEMKKLHEQYQASLVEFEAKANQREKAQNNYYSVQQPKGTPLKSHGNESAQLLISEGTKQKLERQPQQAKKSDTHRKYKDFKLKREADAETIRFRDAELQRVHAETEMHHQARLEAERRTQANESSRSTFSSPQQSHPSFPSPPTPPMGHVGTPSMTSQQTNNPPNLTKFKIDKFSAREAYQGLGVDFDAWLQRFHEEIEMEIASNQTTWTETHRYMALKKSLDEPTARFVMAQEKSWIASVPNGEVYTFKHLTSLMAKMRQEKRYAHTWNGHVKYLRHIQRQIGAPDSLVLSILELFPAVSTSKARQISFISSS
ncbi:hypothetical protein LEN26_012543 [Aphanomyces euteiches]|nr:hypothetical protein LEN26_012543 [Aphanomyces euteiches]